MKKLMLILLALGTGSLFAQIASNGYYDGNVYASSQTTYTTGGNYGTNYVGGTTNYAPVCAPNRVRWVASSCGTFRWRIVEDSYWIPGGYVYVNGCRRWNDGYYGWRQASRVRINNGHTCYNGCGHGYAAPRPRGGYGHGQVYNNGPRGGQVHGYNGGPRGGQVHGHNGGPRGQGNTYNSHPRGGQGNGYGSHGPSGPRGGNGNNNPRGPRGGR